MLNLYNQDCLFVMDDLISKNVKVDCIITDPDSSTKWQLYNA